MKTATNICPYCEKRIMTLEVDDVQLTVDGRPAWVGMTYGCPFCRKILGVQMNPLTIATDTANKTAKKLGR